MNTHKRTLICLLTSLLLSQGIPCAEAVMPGKGTGPAPVGSRSLGGANNPSANGTNPADLKRPTETMCALNSQAHMRRSTRLTFQEASGRMHSADAVFMANQPTGDLYVDCAKPAMLVKKPGSTLTKSLLNNTRALRNPNAPSNSNALQNPGVSSQTALINPTTNVLAQPQAVLGAPPIKLGSNLYDPDTGALRPPAVLNKSQIYQQHKNY